MDHFTPHPKEIENVLNLPTERRLLYFFTTIADTEEVWGLEEDGDFAAMGDSSGRHVFPLWPARKYAEMMAEGMWQNYRPELIPLIKLTERFLPKMEADGLLVGCFPIPEGKGVVMEPMEFLDELNAALEIYE